MDGCPGVHTVCGLFGMVLCGFVQVWGCFMSGYFTSCSQRVAGRARMMSAGWHALWFWLLQPACGAGVQVVGDVVQLVWIRAALCVEHILSDCVHVPARELVAQHGLALLLFFPQNLDCQDGMSYSQYSTVVVQQCCLLHVPVHNPFFSSISRAQQQQWCVLLLLASVHECMCAGQQLQAVVSALRAHASGALLGCHRVPGGLQGQQVSAHAWCLSCRPAGVLPTPTAAWKSGCWG